MAILAADARIATLSIGRNQLANRSDKCEHILGDALRRVCAYADQGGEHYHGRRASSSGPGGRVLIAIEAFCEVYRLELPALTYAQLRAIYQRLAFYVHEIDDEASRKPPASDTPN